MFPLFQEYFRAKKQTHASAHFDRKVVIRRKPAARNTRLSEKSSWKNAWLLRGAGGRGGGRKKKYQGGGGTSSILPTEMVEDGGFFVLRPRKWKMRGGSSFFGRRNPTPLFFRPIFDPFFGAENRRWGNYSTYIRLRRSRIEDGRGSSIFGSEKRRWGGSSKKAGFFEEGGGGFFEEEGSSKKGVLRRRGEGFFEEWKYFENLKIEEYSIIFDLRVRKSKRPLHLRYSEPKVGSKIAVGPMVK